MEPLLTVLIILVLLISHGRLTHLITYKFKKMSQEFDDLKALAARISASQAKVRADIAKLASQINPGGLTAAEAQELKASLEGIATEEESQDALTDEDDAPAPTPEP